MSGGTSGYRTGAWVVAAALALMATAACRGKATDQAVATRAGAFTVEAALDPDPPRQEGNALRVTVKDAQGKPVESATVGFEYLMPAMGAMAEMRGKGEVSAKGSGRYEVKFDVPMTGAWNLTLTIEAGGQRASAEYRMTVGAKGLTAAGTPAAAGPGEASRSADHGAETGVVVVDAQRRQAIGVRTEPVQRRLLVITIRAAGKVAYDQTRLHDVSVKYKGWIADLVADEPGQPVRKGQALFTLYSPELYAAQEELLSVITSQKTARATSAPDRADYLVQAARQRLRLWDLTETQIDRIAATGHAVQNVPIVSPVSGHLVEKNVVDGAAVEPGMRLLRIAGLDRVWVEADVYESELPLVKVGQAARVVLPYEPHRDFQGRISFVYPYVDPSTRTARVRVELANPGLELKPDMYANVELQRDLGFRLAVPEQAVLYAGERRFVFLDLGQGRLRPEQIEVGARAGDLFEVVKGLEEGDVIVTSGNFLVAAESRLKLAMEQWK
jgi:Cu(I)/Ag(I) efflux system membrane fusion protein